MAESVGARRSSDAVLCEHACCVVVVFCAKQETRRMFQLRLSYA